MSKTTLDEILSEFGCQAIRKTLGIAGLSIGQNEAKQAITSLIKELVAEAKPNNNWLEGSDLFHGQDEGVGEFEQNLLKALEEV